MLMIDYGAQSAFERTHATNAQAESACDKSIVLVISGSNVRWPPDMHTDDAIQ